MRGRTSFVIAHRLKTIEKRSNPCYKGWKNFRKRDHESLMEDKGFYFDLYTSQFKI